MRVNDTRILIGFFAANGMQAKADEILNTLSSCSTRPSEQVRRELIDEIKMLPCKAENLMDFIAVRGSNSDILCGLRRYCGMDKMLDEGIASLEAFAEKTPCAVIDLTLTSDTWGIITADP